ncbi:FAD-dependent oxidoreductase [Candidatus Parcubacteria bacterium]|nr:FAD-dependent oxidoreductase [Candidatus Parcubacteria bacterium]
MYDTIIIGAGPAGYTAGIYAARREMKALIIGKEPGGQVAMASEIENYPGFKSINSYELVLKFQEQVKALGVEIKNSEVKEIVKLENDSFEIKTGLEVFKTKTVIIAIGLSPRRLAIKGEQEFAGKGVSYCANCDGPFYKNKIIAVVGGGNAAVDAAELLSKIGQKVYLIHRSEKLTAFNVLVDEVKSRENIDILLNTEIKEIIGSKNVKKVQIINNEKHKEKFLDVDGVFVEIGRIAHTDLIENFVERDNRMQIKVDEKCRTKTKGMFACGDVTNVPFKQITTAVGQATIAALAAYQYIQLKDKE